MRVRLNVSPESIIEAIIEGSPSEGDRAREMLLSERRTRVFDNSSDNRPRAVSRSSGTRVAPTDIRLGSMKFPYVSQYLASTGKSGYYPNLLESIIEAIIEEPRFASHNA